MIHTTNQLNMDALQDMNNIDSGMKNLDLNKLDALNDQNTLTAGVDPNTGVFENILVSGLDKLNSSEKSVASNVDALSNKLSTDPTTITDPSLLNNLQAAMATDVTNFTVGAKVVNLGVKFVNEMTHLN